MDARGEGASRRALLLGGLAAAGALGAGLLSSCGPDGSTSGADAPDAGATASPPLTDEGRDDVRAGAASRERDLIAAYDAALARRADPLLASIRAQHEAHLAALGGGGAAGPAPSEVTTAVLVSLERDAAAACRQACMDTTDAELARTFAFIAASEASHAPALRAQA